MSEEIARKLKAARAKTDETQGAFAKRLGVSTDAVISWENDRRTPRGLALEALNAKLDAILKGKK
ncbi:helix-turn-helix domain-containing protein [Roseimicrobium sp. ORNL1]|uniref:helix-turn-helix domain-containing protein n=1 Tax=Roseimicrobium sp. ORNL1 TaxID=2711231 RepID=UPI0013E11CB1|nr:helix-turn-helix domain-containing protein [Roseimicrobium sp. ORNL1]QIF04640.1 helix-turn-helix domain-containing protein [Roseimicrobium sp. ORNL1]